MTYICFEVSLLLCIYVMWAGTASNVANDDKTNINRCLHAYFLYWKALFFYLNFNVIELSAVIMQFNIVRYYMNDNRNWGRLSIRCWIHKRPRPNGRAGGVLMNIFEKIGWVITAPHSIYIGIPFPLPSLVQIMACHLVGAKPLSAPMLEYR